MLVFNFSDGRIGGDKFKLLENKKVLKAVMNGKSVEGGIEALIAEIVKGFKVPIHSLNFYSMRDTYFEDGASYEFGDMYKGYKRGMVSTESGYEEPWIEYDEDDNMLVDEDYDGEYSVAIFF